jgi:hypothetical protein
MARKISLAFPKKGYFAQSDVRILFFTIVQFMVNTQFPILGSTATDTHKTYE